VKAMSVTVAMVEGRETATLIGIKRESSPVFFSLRGSQKTDTSRAGIGARTTHLVKNLTHRRKEGEDLITGQNEQKKERFLG